jgi:hypothetical protein
MLGASTTATSPARRLIEAVLALTVLTRAFNIARPVMSRFGTLRPLLPVQSSVIAKRVPNSACSARRALGAQQDGFFAFCRNFA